MDEFILQHQDRIHATLSCFDRIIFTGRLPLGFPDAIEAFLTRQGVRLKDFNKFAPKLAETLKQHAKAMAAREGRDYIHLQGRCRKEELARAIAKKQNIKQGLICVLAAVEGCQSFKIKYGKGRPRLRCAARKCLCLYYYFLDHEFGFMHVRIPTWLPFNIQVYINGHEWLAKKMDRHGLRYRRLENAFLWLADPKRAQRFADHLAKKNWPRILEAFARRVNPLLRTVCRGLTHYWVTDQAEYATDLLFKDRASLQPLYSQWLTHTITCLSAEDVMTFLGRKLHGGFQGELTTHLKRRRVPGARVRHQMKRNWIKMYDKHGVVLRVETVINQPTEFKIRRHGIRQGRRIIGYFPMAKRVTNLHRYAEVSLAANRRYLEALAPVPDHTTARKHLHRLARPVHVRERSHRGFNPLNGEDQRLFRAVLRGEYAIQGFRNRDVRAQLFRAATRSEERRLSARVSRLFKRLHVRGLIAKVPRSRRWRVTRLGQALLTAAVQIYRKELPDAIAHAVPA